MRNVGLDVHHDARELREADRVVEEVERLVGVGGGGGRPRRGMGFGVAGEGVITFIIIIVAFVGAKDLEARSGAEDVVDVVGG